MYAAHANNLSMLLQTQKDPMDALISQAKQAMDQQKHAMLAMVQYHNLLQQEATQALEAAKEAHQQQLAAPAPAVPTAAAVKASEPYKKLKDKYKALERALTNMANHSSDEDE